VSELCSEIFSPYQDSLTDITIRIRSAHSAVNKAAGDLLAHAMVAGDALIEAHQQIPHGKWGAWLRHECQLSVRTAARYVQLAKARSLFESSNASRTTDLTIAGALRLLGNGPRSKPINTKKSKITSELSFLEWNAANLEHRRFFLSNVGLPSILAAMPPGWHRDIERRIVGQRAAAAAASTGLSAKVTKSLQLALSTKNPGESIAALNAVRRLLQREGCDLHDLAIAVETKTAKRAA